MYDPTPPFELLLQVLPEDIDQLHHVNNVVYLRWVQDVAIAHWAAAASPEARDTLFWVVTRHEIDYRHPALPRDAIIARTWVGHASKRLFERFTEIRRASDQTVLARARTLWCPMDIRTGRPTKVSDEVRAAFSSAAAAEPVP